MQEAEIQFNLTEHRVLIFSSNSKVQVIKLAFSRTNVVIRFICVSLSLSFCLLIVIIFFFFHGQKLELEVTGEPLLGNLISMIILAIKNIQKRAPFLPSRYCRSASSRENFICIPNFRNREFKKCILWLSSPFYYHRVERMLSEPICNIQHSPLIWLLITLIYPSTDVSKQQWKSQYAVSNLVLLFFT